MKLKKLCSAVALILFLTTDVIADDWPQFRGPRGNGVLNELEHPENWSDDQNIAWSVELPGGGLSSPVVRGERIFVTTAVGANRPVGFSEGVRDMRPKRPESTLDFQVICLDLKDGAQLWNKSIVEKRPEYPIHGSNSFATESPATDGKHLFVYFAATGTIAALDFDGNEIWKQEIGAYPTGNGFGPGSSLAIGGGRVFIQCDNDKSSFVIAFDAATGDQVWRKDRKGRTSWSTPLFWQNEKRTELVTCGSGFVTSYDPDTGDELWTITGISSAFSGSPAADKKRVYFGNSGPRSSGPLLAVSAGMSGDHEFVPDEQMNHLDWSKMRAGPGLSSPVCASGRLYIPGRGILTCYDADNGSVVYKQRLQLGSIAASLWAAGDRIFLLDEKGKTLVLENSPELKIVATNQIAGDTFWSTPAVAGKSLLIRGATKLYCIRE